METDDERMARINKVCDVFLRCGLIRFLVVIVYCDEVLRTSRDELRENSYFSFIKANSKFGGS